MNGEQLLNLYTIAVAFGLGLVIWGLIALWKRPKDPARLLSISQENLTGVGAFMLALCSVGLSIGFALTLSTSFFIGILFTSLFIGFCIAEFTASFHLAKSWADRRIGLVGASIWLLIGGVLISIIAGQAMIAQKVDEAEMKRMQASAAYQQALSLRQNAQEKVESLAIDPFTVNEAKASLATLKNELNALNEQRDQAIQKREACPDNWFKNCINPANAEIKPLDNKINKILLSIESDKTTLTQYKEYQAAKSYADELLNQPLPTAAKEDATLPGIRALATVLSLPVETIASHVFLFLAVFGEISSIILFYLWGASRYERALLVTSSGQILEGDFTTSKDNKIEQLTHLVNTLNEKVSQIETPVEQKKN